MSEYRQVSMDVVCAGVVWAGGVLLVLTGSIISLGWSSLTWARILGIDVIAFGFLLVATAVCLTFRLMLRRMADRMLGILQTRDDVENRLRQVSPLVKP